MSSMLNMNYLQTFYPNMDPQQIDVDFAAFTEFIRHSLVRKNLTALGYETVSFESDYRWVEIPDADIFYTSQSSFRRTARIKAGQFQEFTILVQFDDSRRFQ